MQSENTAIDSVRWSPVCAKAQQASFLGIIPLGGIHDAKCTHCVFKARAAVEAWDLT